MRYKLILGILIVIAIAVWSYRMLKSTNKRRSIAFTEVSKNVQIVDFGKIKGLSERNAVFFIKNNGNEDLVLEKVDTDCSCTVSKWDSLPIAKGDSTAITLNFHPKSEGFFQKKAFVYCNIEESPVVLILRGEIEH